MTATDLEDLFAGPVIADPYDYFGRLRARAPVHWNERFQLWLVTGYEEVVWLLRRPEAFSSEVIRQTPGVPYPPVRPEDAPLFEEIRRFRADQLVEKDRPDHPRMRGVVHRFFTPTAMEEWRPFVRQAVRELLDEIEPRGTMDVLTELAAPLPVRIIARMLGVPYRDRDRLRELADSILYLNRGEPDRLRPLAEGIRGLLEYTAPLVDERLQRPGADLLSALVQGERDGALTRHQVLVNAGLLLFAGHETTMNLICNGLLAFIRHPAEWDRLQQDPPGRVRLAVEECLRYDPPVKSTQRIAAQDVELGGRTIRRGQRLRWIIAAANRDPAVFPDPDRFDIGRQPNPHLSFGAGVHYCLGVTLARMEGQELFQALAERLERVELAGDVAYHPSLQFRSVRALPVRWARRVR